MNKCLHTELSSHEGTRSEFNPSKTVIKLGIDVHQEFYVVVCQEGGSNPKPAQRFKKKAIVAVARQLAVDLWRIRTGRLQPEELGLSI